MRIPGIPFVQGRNAYSDRDSTKYGIAIHNTSNDASAEDEASYATRRTDGISAHFYVDADSVVQSLDTRARAGHAGSYEGNEHAVAAEITGVNAWTRAQWLERVAWDQFAQVLAAVCREYDIPAFRPTPRQMAENPKVRGFYGHDDMRRAWGGTTHTDPGPNFPWDHLLACVQRALTGETKEDEMPLTDADAVLVSRATVNQKLGNTGPTVGGVLQPLPEQITRVVRLQEAILTAVQGADVGRILARVDEHAAAERARDEAAARERAALLDLVRQGQDGSVDAAEVVRRIGELLTAGTDPGQARE